MRILLVDDDAISRELLADYLGNKLGHQVSVCGSGRKALEMFMRTPFPMILSDIRMPGMDGIALLQAIKSVPEGRLTDFVLLTGFGNLESAVKALRAGAYDYLLKPTHLEELEAVIERIAEHQSLLQDNYELTHCFEDRVAEATKGAEERFSLLQKAYTEVVGIGKLCFSSPQMQDIVRTVERLHEDRTVPVLIEGETGTGKEVVAKLVHYGRGAATSPFISINCSAIPPNLFESELFGYAGGAFSGSKKEGNIGKFELAQKGTIFLDEIGDVPLEMQPKLLRVFQEREFYRVGGLKKLSLDVRIICATNRDLSAMVKSNTFRQDLFYRLNTARIYLPPLRDRKEDIVPLANMFLERYNSQKKRSFKGISSEAVKILVSHLWPGNIRELQNTIERIVLLEDDYEIRPGHLDFLTDRKEPAPVRRNHIAQDNSLTIGLPPEGLDLRELESRIIHEIMNRFGGNKTRTAAYFGIARNSLRNKLNKNL